MAKKTAPKQLRLFTQESPIIIFVILAMCSIAIMSYDHRHKINVQLKQKLAFVITPFHWMTNAPYQLIREIDYYLSEQNKLQQQILSLKSEANLLQAIQQKLTLIENENRSLRKILNIKNLIKNDMTIGEVVLPSQANGVPQLLINKGMDDGIDIGSPVMNNEGLVGQVIHVNKNLSTVQKITSNNFAISGISENGTMASLIFGNGSPHLVIYRLPAYEKLRLGDHLLTSGLDQIYPKGIKIGKVIKIIPTNNSQFNEIIIEPATSPQSFSQVMVIKSGNP
ncbi:MAG: rod shape-determining protein MreC [Nitrosomonadales bacterium]|nr:rod shape-determining protein MreC [Nitrosomonadales bacterium]